MDDTPVFLPSVRLLFILLIRQGWKEAGANPCYTYESFAESESKWFGLEWYWIEINYIYCWLRNMNV